MSVDLFSLQKIQAQAEAVLDLIDELQNLRNEAANLRAENLCDVCLGEEPLSGRPCICGGTGKMSDAVFNMRLEMVTARAERDRLLKALEPAQICAALTGNIPFHYSLGGEVLVGSLTDLQKAIVFAVRKACGL